MLLSFYRLSLITKSSLNIQAWVEPGDALMYITVSQKGSRLPVTSRGSDEPASPVPGVPWTVRPPVPASRCRQDRLGQSSRIYPACFNSPVINHRAVIHVYPIGCHRAVIHAHPIGWHRAVISLHPIGSHRVVIHVHPIGSHRVVIHVHPIGSHRMISIIPYPAWLATILPPPSRK